MAGRQIKFIIGPAIIVLTMAWIGYSAFQQMGTYDQTVSELYAMADAGDLTAEDRVRVTGEVVPGTIRYEPGLVTFDIAESGETLRIQYVSTEPLPDTFRDYSEAVVTGHYTADGLFSGTHLQAKCASRYEREFEAGVITSETSELLPPSQAAQPRTEQPGL
jgi:cytochrome c-type biogenesis protein CcmE